jgi:hypothetical protein
VRTGIGIYLFYADGFKGLKYEIDLIDIEATFLAWRMDKPTYIE